MIYFKSIQIKGYKGFVDSGIVPLCVPDGTSGSGLNIFVGENSAGKSSFLKAISLLTVTSGGQNRVASADFNNKTDEGSINIVASLQEIIKYSMPAPWTRELDIKEFHVSIKNRDRKAPGKLLSPRFTISNILEPISRTITKASGDPFDVTDFYLSFDAGRLGDDGLNIFFWDLDRTRQSRKGYSTTFARVMEDLNWRFLKEANQTEIIEKWKEYCEKIISDDLGEAIKTIFKEKFNRADLSEIKIQLLDLAAPYTEAFLGVLSKDKLTTIRLSDLGSGVDFLFTILFLRQIASQSRGSIIYCIDEPELSLHPQWQKSLFEILKEEAKSKQIFIATHSLHFIDPSILRNIKKFDLVDDKITISSFTEEQLTDKKINDLFSLENRELLFSRSIVLVEGWEDRVRIRKFLQSQNNDIFVLDGLQNLERVKTVCSALNIKFKAVVDLDYLRNYANLIPDLTAEEISSLEEIKELDGMLQLTSEEKTKKEISKIKNSISENKLKLLSSKIKAKMGTDVKYKGEIDKKISELKKDNIFVLPSGMIEDYLDSDGTARSSALEQELKEILI